MAYRVAIQGNQYVSRVAEQTKQNYPTDQEKAQFSFDITIKKYQETEENLLNYLAAKNRQSYVEKSVKKARKTELLTNPDMQQWQEQGTAWDQANQQENVQPLESLHQREKIILEIAKKHKKIIASQFSAVVGSEHRRPGNDNQDYFYFFLKPHDRKEKSRLAQRVKNVNQSQDSLVGNLMGKSADQVLATPTSNLKEVFKELEVIGREVKVHLMPNAIDTPMVVDRLLQLLEDQPEYRDLIQAIKVRTKGSNSKDDLPEIVIYSDDENLQKLLFLLQSEFCDLQGDSRTPRFNQEVANGLIYYAQSGGDLKEKLDQLGVLDKLFNKNLGHAQLRV